jgi:hypothetical protein
MNSSMENELIIGNAQVVKSWVPPLPSNYSNSFTSFEKAEATKNAYLSDWEDFCMWCNEKQRQFMPANPHDVADYLEDRTKNSWIGISGKGRILKEKKPLSGIVSIGD